MNTKHLSGRTAFCVFRTYSCKSVDHVQVTLWPRNLQTLQSNQLKTRPSSLKWTDMHILNMYYYYDSHIVPHNYFSYILKSRFLKYSRCIKLWNLLDYWLHYQAFLNVLNSDCLSQLLLLPNLLFHLNTQPSILWGGKVSLQKTMDMQPNDEHWNVP